MTNRKRKLNRKSQKTSDGSYRFADGSLDLNRTSKEHEDRSNAQYANNGETTRLNEVTVTARAKHRYPDGSPVINHAKSDMRSDHDVSRETDDMNSYSVQHKNDDPRKRISTDELVANMNKGKNTFAKNAMKAAATVYGGYGLASGLATAPLATTLSLAGGVGGGKLVDNATKNRTGKTWGEYAESKGWVPEGFGDYTNPGYVIGGYAGAKATPYVKQAGQDVARGFAMTSTGKINNSDITTARRTTSRPTISVRPTRTRIGATSQNTENFFNGTAPKPLQKRNFILKSFDELIRGVRYLSNYQKNQIIKKAIANYANAKYNNSLEILNDVPLDENTINVVKNDLLKQGYKATDKEITDLLIGHFNELRNSEGRHVISTPKNNNFQVFIDSDNSVTTNDGVIGSLSLDYKHSRYRPKDVRHVGKVEKYVSDINGQKVKGVSERLYNGALMDNEATNSGQFAVGELLYSPEQTLPIYNRFNKHKIGDWGQYRYNHGEQVLKQPDAKMDIKTHQPVYILNEPNNNAPIFKSGNGIDLNLIDKNGRFIVDWNNGSMFRAGGRKQIKAFGGISTSTGKRVQARTGSIQRQIEERNLAISQAHARNKAARNAVKGNLKSFIKTPKLKYLGRAISSAYKGYIAPEHPEVQGGIAPTPGISKVRPKQILNVRSILNNVRGHVKNLNVKGTSAIREGLNTADKWAKSTRQQLVNAINQDVTNIKDNTLKAKALASQRAAYRELMKRKAAAVENSQTQAINAGRNSSATINTKNMTDAQLRSFIGEDNSLLTGRQQGQAARDVYAARQELNAREAAAKVKQARLDKAKATRDANRKAAKEEAARKAQANADRAAKAKATREAHKVAAENAKYEAELAAKERATKASFTKAQKKAASSNSSTFEHNGSTYFTDSGNEVTGYKLGVGEANYNEAIKNGWSDYENGWGRISSISEKPSFESYGRAGTVSHTKPQSTSLWQRGKNNVHEWSARRKANSYNTKAEQQGHNVRMTTDGKGNTSFTTKEELAARNQPATNQTSATTGNSGNNSSATGDNPPTSPTQPTRWRDRHSVFGYPIRHPWKTVTGAGVIGAGITGIIKANSTPNATLPAQSSGPAVQHDYEDNTRRRYDTGSSMDANKFGGKRKHRVGGQLRGNDFFRQSPTRKVTSGDRKKALVGTETWRDELAKPVKGIEYKDYKPSWSGIRLAGVNIDGTVLNQRDLKPLELSPTISKGQARRIKIGNIWNNITNGIALNDAIGAGANLIGSGISAYINHRTNNRMKAPSAPMPLSAQKLKTTYNINPQLDAINEQVGNTIRDTNSNTASSNVALQRTNAARLAGMQAKNTLYATKENKEAELINTDRLNKQSVVKNNVTNYNAWRDKVTDFNNAKNQTRADINNSLVNNINSVVQNLITRRERRKFDENNLIATMMAYPNVNPDMLLAMGLIDKEQAEMIKLGRKKPTNTND